MVIVMNRLIEVCAGSYQDCLAAAQGGADRAELNSALSVGGLTPSLASLRLAKRDTKLKIICMVRPRSAGFCYEEEEISIMLEDARILLDNGADGIAFGFLNQDGSVDVESTKKMTELIHSYPGKEAVFHRAFDVTKDPFLTMETLISCGIDRVLTSGQQAKACEGAKLIRELQKRFGGQIEILAGSGVNASNAKKLMEDTGIHQVHSSCKSFRHDPTTSSENVSYAYLDGEHRNDYDIVDEKLVEALVKEVK